MKNWRLNHPRYISAVFSGAGVILATSCKAHLVVDNYVYRSTGFVGPCLRHLECLHNHTLASKCSVAMNDNRQYQMALFVFASKLSSAHRAFNNWRDNFQMRWIECHCYVDFTSGGHNARGESLMVFYVTGTFVNCLPLKLIEQICGVLA